MARLTTGHVEGGTWRSTRAADAITQHCTAQTAKGKPCQGYALRDGSGLCRSHSMSPAERKQLSRDMRAAKRANELQDALAEAEAERRRLEARAAQEQAEDPRDVYTQSLPGVVDLDAYWNDQLDKLREKSEHEREERALSAVLGDRIASDPTDYAALRASWFEQSVRCSPQGELYVVEVPEWYVGPGERRSQVMRDEAPSFDGWTATFVGPSHVVATAPGGAQTLVAIEKRSPAGEDVEGRAWIVTQAREPRAALR